MTKIFLSMAITVHQLLIMKKSMLFIFIMVNLNVMGQSAVHGEYYFNKHEMVAGFIFLVIVRLSSFIRMGQSIGLLPAPTL